MPTARKGRRKARRRAGGAKGDPRTRSTPSTLAAAQQAIGNFLRATRAAQRLTQEQVAKLTHEYPWQLSRAAISAIERGQNFPGMEAMLALSNVLHVDPKELLERARLSTAVPVDITDTTFDELDDRAAGLFWAGDFRKALAVYDAMLEKATLEGGSDVVVASRVGTLEVRRATTLKRAGALLAAIATAERAISLSVGLPEIQAEAYVVLADLQVQRGHLPLAADAAQRAIELSRSASPQRQGWAWMVRARVHFLSGNYETAREAFLEARRQAELSGDDAHLTHADGNVGICLMAEGRTDEARTWLQRAVDQARRHRQPALEASWLIELGKVALAEAETDAAEASARAALEIARPRKNYLTIFRAEWLRHQVVMRTDSSDRDTRRLDYLAKLYSLLDQHEGIEEVQEYKEMVMHPSTAGKEAGS